MTAPTPTPDTPAPLSAREREELASAIKWRLDHYGPLDAEPFQFSRYESPAHAALSAVEESDWLADLVAERDALAERVERAKALHTRDTTTGLCEPCAHWAQKWPCETLRALGVTALDVPPEPDETGGGR